ncbi:MAG TPA: hypothetical protein VHP11_03845 [Tepidisphaeraceae bacterium]|nr:hypothetical protein [Tepidisphaeraceae bacterium]
MKRIVPGLLVALIAVSGVSCSKMKMPKMPQVKLFKDETPEQKVQKQFAAVVKSTSDAQFYKETGTLLELAQKLQWDNSRLLTAALDYQPQVETDDQAATYQRLLDLLRVPKSAVVALAAPKLSSSDAKQAELSRTLLRSAAPADPRGAADFSQFTQYLAANQAQPPQQLILWMYDRDPAAAMEQMLGIYGQKLSTDDLRTLRIATRVLDQMAWKERYDLSNPGDTDALAVQQAETLSQYEQWWIRLYVAKMVVKYPALRKTELVTRLTQDPNPMVAAVAGQIGK